MEAAVALLLVLRLVSGFAPTASPVSPTQGVSCPSNCSCALAQRHVTCQAGLTSLPEGLPTDIRELRLSSNQFPILSPGSFSNLFSLTALHLTDSQVSLVQPGAFQGLYSLRYLHLDNNRIEQLEYGVFEDLAAVTYLYLTNNQISALTPGLFSSMKRLNALYLGGNRLTEIPNRAFHGLANLRWLYLSRNLIAGISPSAFQYPRSLRRLHLDGNLLTGVPSTGLVPLTRLTVLDLSGNRIASLLANSFSRRVRFLVELWLDNNTLGAVHSSAFSKLFKLQLLSLTDNRLQTLIFARRLRQLVRLRVAGNPWLCDCRLDWLWHWLQRANQSEAELERVACGSPDALSGLPLVQVPLQQMTCPPFAPNSPTVPPRPVTVNVPRDPRPDSPRPFAPVIPAGVGNGARQTAKALDFLRPRQTADPCLSERIRDIAVSEVGESSLLVNWLVDRDLGDEYEVRYETGGQSQEVRMIGGVNEVELSELRPGAAYTVCVVPQGGAGAEFGPCLWPEPQQCTLTQTLAISSWVKRQQVAFGAGLTLAAISALLLAACLVGFRLKPKSRGFRRHYDDDGGDDGHENSTYVEHFSIDQGGYVNPAAAIGDRAST